MKIVYTDFWPDFNPHTLPLTKIINSIAELEEEENLEKADYLLYSCMGQKHWLAPDDTIKIFYTGENMTPDFNACDYAIGFDWLDFGDRYLRFPLYYLYGDICEQMEEKHLVPMADVIKNKKDFCSVTISNADRNLIFKELFYGLSSYKQVESGGKWENNVGGPVQDKFSFDSLHKFSIVCENSSSPGYTTEKIVQAFAANCIPIYWGDPEIGRVFNKKAFVNVQDYTSVDEVVRKVIEIDNDDRLYNKMLQEPALVGNMYSKESQLQILKNFLSPIFLAPFEKAKRRNRDYWGKKYVYSHRDLYCQLSKKDNWLKLKEIIYDIIH